MPNNQNTQKYFENRKVSLPPGSLVQCWRLLRDTAESGPTLPFPLGRLASVQTALPRLFRDCGLWGFQRKFDQTVGGRVTYLLQQGHSCTAAPVWGLEWERRWGSGLRYAPRGRLAHLASLSLHPHREDGGCVLKEIMLPAVAAGLYPARGCVSLPQFSPNLEISH